MRPTNTPLFATDCIGQAVDHVDVFPTHITYRQKFGRDISIGVDMIARVEKREYTDGFVILYTTGRRRIICTVHRKRAEPLYAAIRDAQRQ